MRLFNVFSKNSVAIRKQGIQEESYVDRVAVSIASKDWERAVDHVSKNAISQHD